MGSKDRSDLENQVFQNQGMHWGRYQRKPKRTQEEKEARQADDQKYRDTHKAEIRASNRRVREKKARRLKLLEKLAQVFLKRHPEEARQATIDIDQELTDQEEGE